MMKNKLVILSFSAFLFVFLFASSTALADVIIPGTKDVNSCYEISNIANYSDYVFLTYEWPMPHYGIISAGECFGPGYKLGSVSIYAIGNLSFNESELQGENATGIMNYFENNTQLIPSDIQLRSYGLVPEDSHLEKAVTVLNIVSLNTSNLQIQKSKIIYTYADGTSEEKSFQNQDVAPEPSKKATSPSWFASLWYVIIPILAIAVIVLILVLRRLRK